MYLYHSLLCLTVALKMEGDYSVSRSCRRSRSLLLVFFAFSPLSVAGFAIYVDTELFLGVGLSNNRVILA